MSVQYIKDIKTLAQQLLDCDLIVTDTNVKKLYSFLSDCSCIEAGEAHKNIESVLQIIDNAISKNLNRKSVIAAVGGGVVGDLSGFASAIYMRGIDFISVPTTLLAMVDSGTGGKTGCDYQSYKNIIGAFHSPVKTLVCLEFLKTLPKREIVCGLGETVKTLMLDKVGFDLLNETFDDLILSVNRGKIIESDLDAYSKCVKKCIEIKSDIVERDPLEVSGIRKQLNFGHTVGHALESADGFSLSHGEYVLIGMRLETELIKDRVETAFYNRLCAFCDRLTMCIDFDPVKVTDAAKMDKKNVTGKISVVALTNQGQTEEVFFTPEQFAEKLAAALKTVRN